MNPRAILFVLPLVACSASPAAESNPSNSPSRVAPEPPTERVLLRPDDLEWRPAGALPPGAEMAILEGDPTRPGFFALRLRLPPNYRIPPHYHPAVERVTVLEGTFLLGAARTWDEAALRPYPPGSYLSLPVGMAHFAGSGGDTVVIQLASLGPWEVVYVDPEDDPRPEPPRAAVR